MLVLPRQSADRVRAAERLKAWTRTRFNLDPAATVMVAEVACGVPGCPPVESVVAFWTGDGTRYRFKLFKPLAEATYDDLPYAWLMRALVDDGGSGLECC